MKLVYHYTSCLYLPEIVESGALIPPAGFLTPGESPLLSFSSNRTFELSQKRPRWEIFKSDGTTAALLGFCRFSLPLRDPRIMSWEAACTFARMPSLIKHALDEAGRAAGGNPKEWYACANSIPLHELAFSVLGSEDWEPAEVDTVVKSWAPPDEKIARILFKST